MKKLWQEQTQLDPIIESFETQIDLEMDQKLIPYDIEASIAHAKMLEKIEVLTKEELTQLLDGLAEIAKLHKEGKFVLQMGDEDAHTKIENYLTEKYPIAGKKIHTGRSRNDQALNFIRMFEKAKLEEIEKQVEELIASFKVFDKKYGEIPMPGYTHMQKAMPSTMKMWIGSFIASLESDLKTLEAAKKLIDQSVMGSGAGYGVPLNLDKIYSAEALGFTGVIDNPIFAQSSKGKFEAFVLSSLTQVLQTVNKFASDVLLFSTQEFGFFTASSNITTGSSIMPQKKNLDVAELLRSKVHVILGNFTQVVSMTANLPSGYNRDLQDVKKPVIESLEITLISLKVTKILVKNIAPNKEKLKSAMTKDLYAAERALDLVKKGESFRDAYKKIKEEYE